MMNELIYAYCMSDSAPVLDNEREDTDLQAMVFGAFHIIVKYVSGDEFSEEILKKNMSDLHWMEANAREHIRVINMIMESGNVIPFKFGTIYNSTTGLEKFIADYSSSLIDNFNNVEGKEEWSVKIYCDRKVLGEHIDEYSEEASSLEKQILASSPGRAFLLKRKKTDMVENEIDRLCNAYGQEYFDDFKNLSESTSLNNLLPKEYTGRQDSMILNATFLVFRDSVDEFKNVAATLGRKYGNAGFIIETTGPWPPFSFISIKKNSNGG